MQPLQGFYILLYKNKNFIHVIKYTATKVLTLLSNKFCLAFRLQHLYLNISQPEKTNKMLTLWFCFYITYRFSKTAPSWCHFACSWILGKKWLIQWQWECATCDQKTCNNMRVCFSTKDWCRFASLNKSLFWSQVVTLFAMVQTSLFPRMQLHAKWCHEGAVLLQR